MYRRRNTAQGFFRRAWAGTQRAGRYVDNFVRSNGNSIRSFSQVLAPMIAPQNPAAAAALAAGGQFASNYGQLRDALDRAAT